MPASASESRRDRIARRCSIAAAVLLALSYGVLAGSQQWFPYSWFASAADGWQTLAANDEHNWYFRPVRQPAPPRIQRTAAATPGWNLITQIEADSLAVRVLDLDGNEIHGWQLDWFALWPDASHVPARLQPQRSPGTHINGAALLEDGRLVFNFEHLGLVCVDRSGAVVWRLAYQTHHSVLLADDGKLWVCGQREHDRAVPRWPQLKPPFIEDTVLVVDRNGKIEREWSVPDLLLQNGRAGLLTLGSRDDFAAAASGDVTHLNHVEPFPAAMRPGYFRPGDVLISLRNLNTVLVFDSKQDQIKFACTGLFVRQHDPHFLDGNHISVFDNNTAASPELRATSRILVVAAPTQQVQTWFAGSAEQPFYTPILGRHQWLPNGHLLITDSCAGRAFELDQDRRIVWWYINYVDGGHVGAIEQVQRIPVGYALGQRSH